MNPKSKVRRKFKPSTRITGLRQLPFVFVNFAMTADGKIAFDDRKFVPFTSERDREHMMELRATADAVMSGARTVDSGEVTLGTGGEKYRQLRRKRGLPEYNLRIVVSGSGSVDPEAAIFKKGKGRLIILTTERAGKKRLQTLNALADEVKVCGTSEIDFRHALAWLRKKWNVKRLLCEGGGELNGALVHAGVVNEVHLVISPKIFGGRNAPTLAEGDGFTKLADAAQFKLKSRELISEELFLVFSAAK
jgi:2,5-diamino-6-(ribosylamino)-4(3H)-pyrimidinone 5'-phosphate reductase